MKVTLDIDSDYQETRVTIHCSEMDESIKGVQPTKCGYYTPKTNVYEIVSIAVEIMTNLA